jgi:hypothetical protein
VSRVGGVVTGERVRWTNGVLWRYLLHPVYVAGLLFYPSWIPEPLDPPMETLRRVRAIAGLLTYCGVYAVLGDNVGLDDFGIGAALRNLFGVVWLLLIVHPMTVGVMLLIWKRRGFPIRVLRAPVLRGFVLLAGYVVSLLILIRLTIAGPETWGSFKADTIRLVVALWLFCFFVFASLAVARHLFGSAAIHPGLPALLAAITAWLAALPDLKTGDVLGLVFVLGGPVTVTAIAALELSRLRRHHGIELHPVSWSP